MAEGPIGIERGNGLLLITIAREEVRNALDAAASAAIDRAIDEGEADPRIRVTIITGAGDRAFCSGMDMKEAARIGVGHGLIPGKGFAGITERRRRKPLIAAVNGAAVAGGFEIALACDIVIAAEHAVFGLSEVKRGLFAFAGGIQRLAAALPRASALGMILTGEPLPAARLFDLGLITEIVPTGYALARAREIAAVLAGYSPDAVQNALLLHDMSAGASVEDSLRFGRAFGEATLGGDASKEGVAAFAEHRAADFGAP